MLRCESGWSSRNRQREYASPKQMSIREAFGRHELLTDRHCFGREWRLAASISSPRRKSGILCLNLNLRSRISERTWCDMDRLVAGDNGSLFHGRGRWNRQFCGDQVIRRRYVTSRLAGAWSLLWLGLMYQRLHGKLRVLSYCHLSNIQNIKK
ncbi:hypothetical protein BU23DRAFT_152020 [Bimuria novae-zelandiae CBS 107.79]|uniref:Uncharacterized protein n=1 Tax=Bimuria novae-zelandiae CBS 107.79 TaxID=1447943 RepID=A0A6A5VWN8_9PLEO|nr:hypothetical protein BU23DRAFT_152020 [Bimuria novae-zelandiae CBS 107.79]